MSLVMSEVFLIQLRSYLQGARGSVMPLVALTLPVLMSLSGLGVDASSWLMAQRNLQTAADAAAMAGAWEAGRGFQDKVNYSAEKEAVNNGFVDGQGSIAVEFSEGNGSSVTGDNVEVVLRQDVPVFFLRLLGKESITVEAAATAAVTRVSDEFCILSLDRSQDGALKTSGTVDLMMPDCGIAVNSASDRGMIVNGNVEITVQDVHLSGEYVITGNSAELTYEDLVVGAPPILDPYEDLEVPAFAACTSASIKKPLKITSSTTLNPGVYCGGISASGNNTITLNPGTYIMAGGSFDVSGGGSLVGNGVTIILTNGGGSSGTTSTTYGQFNITGNRSISLTASTSGTYEGITVFQDRNAPSNTAQGNFLTGGSTVVVDGLMYFPKQELNYGGSIATSTSGYCTRMIANTVVMHGTPFIGNDCEGRNERPIGNPVIRLVG